MPLTIAQRRDITTTITMQYTISETQAESQGNEISPSLPPPRLPPPAGYDTRELRPGGGGDGSRGCGGLQHDEKRDGQLKTVAVARRRSLLRSTGTTISRML